MFKRIEKRRRRRKEEEELGLDEDMKEVLGMHDTDSDESDSDSDSGDGANTPLGDDNDEDGSERGQNLMEEADSDEGDDKPPISVREALREPIYIVSIEPDVKSCIVCPRKLLKNPRMTTAHRESDAHSRRFKQFTSASSKANPDDNAWDFTIRTSPSFIPASSELSKRQTKRKAREAAIKSKRAMHKAAQAKARTRKEREKQNEAQILKVAEPTGKTRKRKRQAGTSSADQVTPTSLTESTSKSSIPDSKRRRKVHRHVEQS